MFDAARLSYLMQLSEDDENPRRLRIALKDKQTGKGWRRRRTAYRSGRLELLGIKGPLNQFKPKRQHAKKVLGSALNFTPLKNKSWRRY